VSYKGICVYPQVRPGLAEFMIGKQGRTARSMRTILGAVSMKQHHRYTLEILEDVPHTRMRDNCGPAFDGASGSRYSAL